MTWFLVAGGVGLVLVLVSLLLDDVFDGVFDALGIDAGGGLFSTPVIGSFLAAFGLTGALVHSSTELGATGAALAGAAAGAAMGATAFYVTRALMRMPTDAPVRVADLVGKTAKVVTPIPAGGFGEVSLVHLGQQMKLNAKASAAGGVARGTEVVIVATPSASSVEVEAAEAFWGDPAPPPQPQQQQQQRQGE